MGKLEELQGLLSQKRSKAYYANKLGISELEVERLLHLIKYGESSENTENEFIEQDVENQSLKSLKFSEDQPKSPEEVMELHRADPEKWKLKSYKSEQKGDKWVTTALFSPAKEECNIREQKKLLLKELKEHSKTYRPNSIQSYTKADNSRKDTLLEIAIPDLHFGKLSWRDEVGEDYDLEIAENRVKEAVKELLSRVNLYKVERILFPIGNDLINIDNDRGTTTAGTPQSCDSRFAKMVKVTKSVLLELIDNLAEIAPVDIPIVVGNHDQTISFLIGEILDAYYHNAPNITIDNNPTWRKYYQYYDNGFQFTHGNNEKHDDLGLIFATEMPKMWADTVHRFCQLGHWHKSKRINYVTIDTKPGFQIEVLPSLSSTDSWHSSKGYIATKQAKALLYHRNKGEIASYTFTV